MLKIVIAVVVTAVATVAAVLSFQFIQKQGEESLVATPTPQPAADQPQAETSTPSPTPKIFPSSQVKETITAALETKNTAALESKMAKEVSVILYATECCGALTAAEAVAQLSYLNSATSPWNFSNTNPNILAFRAAYPEYSDAIVGISANDYLVAFKLDGDGKIVKIFITAKYQLLVP